MVLNDVERTGEPGLHAEVCQMTMLAKSRLKFHSAYIYIDYDYLLGLCFSMLWYRKSWIISIKYSLIHLTVTENVTVSTSRKPQDVIKSQRQSGNYESRILIMSVGNW